MTNPDPRTTEIQASIWVRLSREYHREPNNGHSTGKTRDCFECQRIAGLVTAHEQSIRTQIAADIRAMPSATTTRSLTLEEAAALAERGQG